MRRIDRLRKHHIISLEGPEESAGFYGMGSGGITCTFSRKIECARILIRQVRNAGNGLANHPVSFSLGLEVREMVTSCFIFQNDAERCFGARNDDVIMMFMALFLLCVYGRFAFCFVLFIFSNSHIDLLGHERGPLRLLHFLVVVFEGLLTSLSLLRIFR